MKKFKNLEQRNKFISGKLLDSIHLLEILADLADGRAKEDTILHIVNNNNVRLAFKEIEKCRKMISVSD